MPRPADSGTAVYEYWLLQTFACTPHFSEVPVGERGLPHVGCCDMHNFETLGEVVGNQIRRQFFVVLELLLVEQADDRSDAITFLGFRNPSIHHALRDLTPALELNSWSAPTCEYSSDCPMKYLPPPQFCQLMRRSILYFRAGFRHRNMLYFSKLGAGGCFEGSASAHRLPFPRVSSPLHAHRQGP
jgi:hypothetical protein